MYYQSLTFKEEVAEWWSAACREPGRSHSAFYFAYTRGRIQPGALRWLLAFLLQNAILLLVASISKIPAAFLVCYAFIMMITLGITIVSVWQTSKLAAAELAIFFMPLSAIMFALT